MKRSIVHVVAIFASKIADGKMKCFAKYIFKIAIAINELNLKVNNWLALYANQKGFYEDAILYLKNGLCAVPEDPSTRLNLVANLIYLNQSFTKEAINHARIAIIHGGPETVARFKFRLINTKNQEAYCDIFNALFEEVKADYVARQKRKSEILKPEIFGNTVHVELQ